MATTTPSSRLDHLKICMDCSGEGTRHVTDSGKGSLPIRRTVTCARCDGEGLIYVGPEEGREEALRRLRGGRGGGEASGGGRALAAAVDLKEAGDAAYGAQDYAAAVAKYDAASQLDRAYLAPVANRAGAYLKMGRWRDCRRDCARVVAAAARGSDLHLRACLRRAVASEKLGGAEALRAGLADLDVLLKYQPGHPEAVRLRAAVEEDAALRDLAFRQARCCALADTWPCPVRDGARAAAAQLCGNQPVRRVHPKILH